MKQRFYRRRNIVGAFISGLGFIGFSLIVLLTSGNNMVDVDTQNAEDISYQSMEEDNVYWIEKLTVVDRYASLTNSNVNYLMASYTDADGKTVLVSLWMNSSEDYWTVTNDYVEDDNMGIGDCVINGYFELQEDESDRAEERWSYFSDYVTKYKQSGGVPINAVSLKSVLRYRCTTYEELVAFSNTTNVVSKVMGVIALGIGILALYAGFKWISINKKQKAQKAVKTPTVEEFINNTGFFTEKTEMPVSAIQPTQPAVQATPATPVQPTAPAPVASDKMAKLNEYKALVDAGYMTQEEFDQKRKEILQLS